MKYKELGFLTLYRFLPEKKYIVDFRPDWLVYKKQLTVHIYFPNLKLGFQFYSGDFDQLSGNKIRNKARKKICRDNGVRLIEFDCHPRKFPVHLEKILGYKVELPGGLVSSLNKYKFQATKKRKNIGRIVNTERMLRRYKKAQEEENRHSRASNLFANDNGNNTGKVIRGEPFVVKR